MQNYYPANFFRLNSCQFSAYPKEKEVLIIDGAEMYVVGTEDIYINNESSGDEFWQPFNGKTVTVIYLFNTAFGC